MTGSHVNHTLIYTCVHGVQSLCTEPFNSGSIFKIVSFLECKEYQRSAEERSENMEESNVILCESAIISPNPTQSPRQLHNR